MNSSCQSIDPDLLVIESISYYYKDLSDITYRGVTGSVNNIIRYILVNGVVSSVLRIYNNGLDTRKVNFEHFILEKLLKSRLSFQVPKSIPSLLGQHIITLSNGFLASLFELIPGKLVGNVAPYEIGKASGELSNAFAAISSSLSDVELSMIANPPLYDIYAVHTSMSKDAFQQQITLPVYDSCREDMNFLANEIIQLEIKLAELPLHHFRHQLIHGDLHYDNVLCTIACSNTGATSSIHDLAVIRTVQNFVSLPKDEYLITGILDFEFCALDWAITDFAICLAKYTSERDPLMYIEEFSRGFASTSCKFCEEELRAVPTLIQLRILSNVIFFMGRASVGEDTPAILTGGKASVYSDRIRWIENHSQDIIALLVKYFTVGSS